MHAIGRISYSFLTMLLSDAGLVVTVEAGVGRDIVVGMASSTVAASTFVVDGKGVAGQADLRPGIGVVAPTTLVGEMVGRSGCSVAALAVGEPDVVKDRSFPALCASVALAALTRIVVRRCGQSVTALAIGKADVAKDRSPPALWILPRE